SITMRLAVRTPYAGRALLGFLAVRAVPGIEAAGDGWYARSLSLPHGSGTVRLEIPDVVEFGRTAFVTASFALEDLRDTAAATERVRRMLDADCDPLAVADAFAGDPVIGPLVRALPGLRVPGHVDGHEIAVRAVIGQQVSVAGARTVAARLVEQHGRPLANPVDGLTHLFPDAATLAGLSPEDLPMPRARGRALIALCAALASGDLALDRGPDRNDVRRALLEIPGIGPWTADYIALRALGHPDVFLPTDIGIRDALAGLGRDPSTAAQRAVHPRRRLRSAARHRRVDRLPVTRRCHGGVVPRGDADVPLLHGRGVRRTHALATSRERACLHIDTPPLAYISRALAGYEGASKRSSASRLGARPSVSSPRDSGSFQ
ncbi:MAG: DNA-O6-methylguanine--protein-cysteine S-methyltransferase / DNA-3-methyladenine glycosylase, partial [Mycobacterium sp.]|nr:DNA-O6-methylguanine--protein-cysteine S-methyltransferase / DNA-3-methyladenine glycosylase [Mycobacterium sp.]